MSGGFSSLDRGLCDACGEEVAVYPSGRPVPHGPVDDRCPASLPPAGELAQTVWDSSAARLPARSSTDERIANGALVANTAASNFTNASRRGTR